MRDLLAQVTNLRDELGLTVQDLQAHRNHLRDAATRLRLGVRRLW